MATNNLRSLLRALQPDKFSLDTRRVVWNKAIPIKGCDSSVIRQDVCGAFIAWDKYGDTTPKGMGWEIDHIVPESAGGTDHISNLQPLQWQNNRTKGDSPVLRCAVRAVVR